MERTFKLAEARALLGEVRAKAAEIAVVRADLVELSTALRGGGSSPLGGVAEAKGLEARLAESLDWFSANGIQVKGWAPLIIDFPGEVGGEVALLCWLEGEPGLDWWHRPEHGFAGRRRL